MRRLPVYILLDCSESMVGDAINSVQTGLEMLLGTLRSDPHCLETAWVSIIAFSQDAQVLVPLTELTEFQTPILKPRPGTSLGKALSLLRNCIEGEVRQTSTTQKGDYRPLVFLLTDGQPTDDWRTVKAAVDCLTNPRVANFYAIGCGEDVDFEMLNEVSDVVFKLADMEPTTLKKLFIWLTASVQGASISAGMEADYNGIDMANKPKEVVEVAPGTHPRYEGLPLQVFIKVNCLRERQPYLIRYRLVPEMNAYEPLKVHQLELDANEAKGFRVDGINVSQLMGPPPACPYCQNGSLGVCGCNAIMCLPEYPPPSVQCPVCSNTIQLSDEGDGDFEIQQSAG